MAGGAYKDDSDAISDINVTPLVDVFLVLLVIFMVTAPLIAARGINVDKPKTVSGEQVASSLTITIDRDLAIYVNGERYGDPASARAVVEAERKKNPEVKAIIQADTVVPHGEVMAVIDLVTLAGVTKFALASAPKQSRQRGGAEQEDAD